MAKFLNKKEQVIDFRLTSYGHYLLSHGSFKPEYYGFFDDNVIYDIEYAGGSESQNNIHKRIKSDTVYLESPILFEEVENSPNTVIIDGGKIYYEVDVTPIYLEPRKTIFRFNSMIGDAFMEGDTKNAPAWKASLLSGKISSSTDKDTKNDTIIPQVNIDTDYILKIVKPDPLESILDDDIGEYVSETDFFTDGRKIVIQQDNTMIYLEELNTMLLNENFDVEVFEVGVDEVPATHADGNATDLLRRKEFPKQWAALRGSEITEEYFDGIDRIKKTTTPETTNQVEYYFNINVDSMVNQHKACRGIEVFNKNSYYIDLDFECDKDEQENIYYDIYGPVTEPEICP